MTRQRAALYVLLAVVALAAAVLSFSALRDLALLCGFAPGLAWLLPVVIDAGAAAGSIVWLARWTPPAATRYGRLLAVALLGSSVGGNALGHGLDAYGTRPNWLVVVGVSAIAPTVLGALVHLVVLVGRPASPANRQPGDDRAPAVGDSPRIELQAGEERESQAGEEREESPAHVALHLAPTPATPDAPGGARPEVGELLAQGAGRRTVARELGVTEYAARQLIDARRGVSG